MQRVTVPGGYVDFREPEETPERLRRRVLLLTADSSAFAARIENSDVAASDLEFLSAFNDAVSLCLIMGWSFDQPVTAEGLQELPGNAYDAIVQHVQPLVPRLLPNFGVDPSPKAPIES